jgi:DNA-directed RNA polymerase specialized sigma24 family protein
VFAGGIMRDLSLQKSGQKKDWALSSHAFERLLNWLDEGTDSEGQNYLEMQRRLVAYFDRKNCSTPHELADETVNRVSRRLEEEGAIANETPAKYCYIVARFVFMEYLRARQKEKALIDGLQQQPPGDNPGLSDPHDQKEIKEKRLDCLERCTGKLEPGNRETILRYYVGKERVKIENRRGLAAELGITMNALSIRASRIRDKLEACVKECVGAK